MIQLNNIKKVFQTEEVETWALRNISLEVKEGEFVAIMGPSGCGKSTLLNIIGLLNNPTSGSYLLDGKDVSTLKESERTLIRRGMIGFVFQSFNLIDELNVYENVELPLLYAGVGNAERRERAMASLEKVGLTEKWKNMPNQLSGGQQQRVSIARALAGDPSVILADEPTGALDQTSGKEVLKLFRELNDMGNTIVMITHDLGVAQSAKRIVRIVDGQLYE